MNEEYRIVICQSCGKKYRIKEPSEKKRYRCIECQSEIIVEPKEKTKKCPFCAEEIKYDAIKCKHCRSFLDGRIQEETKEEGTEQVLEDEKSPEKVVHVEQRKRGGCLTFILISGFIFIPLGIITNLVSESSFREIYPGWPDWMRPINIISGIISFITYIAIWNWKKWGVYLYYQLSVVFSLIQIIPMRNSEYGSAAYIGGIIGFIIWMIIISLLFKKIWKYMT